MSASERTRCPFVLSASRRTVILLRPVKARRNGLESDFAVVPAVWPLEVLNALIIASRRARIGADHLQRILSDLAALPIEVEQIDITQMLGAASELAQRGSITRYDAAYVEVAKRRGLPVATLDRKLKAVALVERPSVIP